jgi:hypothetical protein
MLSPASRPESAAVLFGARGCGGPQAPQPEVQGSGG